MKYLALGDSMSIDDYTGVPGGGSASQFARLVGAPDPQFLAHDGSTTDGVLESLRRVTVAPDVTTLTAGGNDLLQALMWSLTDPGETMADYSIRAAEHTLANLHRISDRLESLGGTVILNTIYDPTDGDDSLSAAIGIPPDCRAGLDRLNRGIRELSGERGFLLSDLHQLFNGHGMVSADPWIVHQIEPNLDGATAMAKNWFTLWSSRPN